MVPFCWRAPRTRGILASPMQTILILALLAQQQAWPPKNLRYFPQDVTREALIQRMRESRSPSTSAVSTALSLIHISEPTRPY